MMAGVRRPVCCRRSCAQLGNSAIAQRVSANPAGVPQYPKFHKPAESLLDEPEMLPGSPVSAEIMHGRNTLIIRFSEISSVDFAGKTKWRYSVSSRFREFRRLFRRRHARFDLFDFD
jgi:hypothetical protein